MKMEVGISRLMNFWAFGTSCSEGVCRGRSHFANEGSEEGRC